MSKAEDMQQGITKIQQMHARIATLEACLAERDAEIERLKAGGWQPIETAPKITDVLCLLESGRASVMYLTDNGQGFMDNWRNPDGTASGHWPTHWMPLPQPPQGETT